MGGNLDASEITAWRERGRDRQRGQILPLFALGATVLIALTGLGLDGARVMLERRQAQGAADLAAIAGAKHLPADSATATTDALAIALANGYAASQVTVTFPQVSQIRVTIDSDVNMLLTPVIGISNTDVPATALAVHTEEVIGGAGSPLAGPAILAATQECDTDDALKWDAHDTVINGDVITNAGGDINGSNNIMNGTETFFETNPACAPVLQQLHIDQSAGANPQPEFVPAASAVSYPLDHTAQPFANPLGSGGLCNVTDMGALGIQVFLMDSDEPSNYLPDGVTLPDGIYCRVDSTAAPTTMMKKVNIKTAGSTCANCTFVSLLIQASAANIDFEPAVAVTAAGAVCALPANSCNGYPLFTYAPPGAPKDGINFSGASQLWDGVMFSPTGTTHYTGHNAAVYDGAIWSNIVQIIGSGFALNGPTEWGIGGPGGPAQPEVLALIE